MPKDSRNRSDLMEIQPLAMTYADILSKLLKVEVTIVDEHLRRVAGTGRNFIREAKKQADISQTSGLLSITLKSGQPQVFENPREYPACRNCEERERCQAKYQISAPIIVQGRVKGVLAFMTSNMVERERMEKKKDLYLNFLKLFSDLMSLKLCDISTSCNQLTCIEALKAMSDYMETGVLIFDSEGNLAFMNRFSRRQISIQGVLPLKAELTTLSRENEKTNVLLVLENREYHLTGSLHQIRLESFSDIFIFSDGLAVKLPDVPEQKAGGWDGILGNSYEALKIRKQIKQYADSSATVLMIGAPGTEKEEIAWAIHKESRQRSKPFISVKCKGLSDEELETALFGKLAKSERKRQVKHGNFPLEGTLFLEGIDSLSLTMQAKLLRALAKTTENSRPSRTQVRIIAAASKDLRKMTEEGSFLGELYYRLYVLPIYVPPLSARKQDIPIIGKNLLLEEARRNGKSITSIEPSFWDLLSRYSWPGNVWQLKSAMEYVVSGIPVEGGIVSQELIPENICHFSKNSPERKEEANEELNLKKIEKQTIQKALRLYGNDSGSKEIVAEKLGVGIATLYRKMKLYGL